MEKIFTTENTTNYTYTGNTLYLVAKKGNGDTGDSGKHTTN